MSMRQQVGQAATAVEQLLRALWHSEFQCRFGSYRTAIILLADVGLEFGMTKRCKRILEEIMPQVSDPIIGLRTNLMDWSKVIDGDDIEQRALACFTLARCIIAADGQSPESIHQALVYLDIAERDYEALEILRSLLDVQFLISVLYHNLNMVEKRDAAAARHFKTEEAMQEAAVVVAEDWIEQVWELVLDIGASLAKR
jgi:anaphase-promoting complex subunit 5